MSQRRGIWQVMQLHQFTLEYHRRFSTITISCQQTDAVAKSQALKNPRMTFAKEVDHKSGPKFRPFR